MQRDCILTRENIYILNQGLELIARLDDRLYTHAAAPLFRYGVGVHFRHCLDSYGCFLRGSKSGRINYDQRERDELIEKNRRFALRKIETICNDLQSLPVSGDEPVLVLLEGAANSDEAASWSQSSVFRELQFLVSHTIHHYAMIAMMLRLQGFEPGEEFGVAPSTLEHWRDAALCAR